MKIRVFNPEHDLALAANLANFTSPHAGRQLRADLGFIPALWAEADDVVMVGDSDEAERKYRILVKKPFGRFVTKDRLRALHATGVDVWGWDLAIRAFLLRNGVDSRLLPSDDQIAQIRELSHRRYAAEVLSQLQGDSIIGEATMITSYEAFLEQLARVGRFVVKAPWSSSGRGVRFVDGALNKSDDGWLRRVITTQGAVMVEPHYNKVKDFGMEFMSDGQGRVDYLGLSLFQTSGSFYTGNVLATEEDKLEIISRYLPVDLLIDIQQKIMAITGILYKGKYAGPFGVDMMVVAREDREGFWLHPCVEINLRRTMGHVAINLTRHLPTLPKLMTIICDNFSYKLIFLKDYL